QNFHPGSVVVKLLRTAKYSGPADVPLLSRCNSKLLLTRDCPARPGTMASAESVIGVRAATFVRAAAIRSSPLTTVRNGSTEDAADAPVARAWLRFVNQLSSDRMRGGAARLVPSRGD